MAEFKIFKVNKATDKVRQEKKEMDNQLKFQEIKTIMEEQLTKIRENSKKFGKNNDKNGHKYVHMRVTELEKQNQILMYELTIHRKLLKYLQINQEGQLFKETQKVVNGQIKANILEKLKKQNQEMAVEIEKLKKEKQQMKQSIKQFEKKQSQNRHKLMVLEKRSNQFDKLGGFSAFQSMKEGFQKVKNDLKKSREQQKQLKQKVLKLTNKCKILEGLNWQTQMQLADLQVQRQNDPKLANGKIQTKKQTKQLMAAKQQIRTLKNKVQVLEKQKKNLKQSHEHRQGIYSKMIAR